jgi:hypothetical protein
MKSFISLLSKLNTKFEGKNDQNNLQASFKLIGQYSVQSY